MSVKFGGLVLALFGFLFIAMGAYFGFSAARTDFRLSTPIGLALVNGLMFGLVVCGGVLISRSESFTLTHFPIRLNRKTRKIYVFRPVWARKPVLVADWDRLFFTFGRCNKGVEPGQNWDIRAHVLAENGKTVLDTFSFSVYMNELDLDGLRAHWEFLRRYMEEGPREAYETVKVCLPIADRRETLRYALNRFYLNFKGGLWLWIMLMPLWLLCVLARWISGLTCRIPKWPQAIQDECRIEPDDPYERDASMNPTNAWEF